MDILKSLRLRLGLRQQDMSALLHLRRDHYAMIETGKRMLTAEAATRFASLLTLLGPPEPLPEMPQKSIANHAYDMERACLQAKRKLYETNLALDACTRNIAQLTEQAGLRNKMLAHPALELTGKDRRILEDLAKESSAAALEKELQKWLYLQTQQEVWGFAVARYEERLTGNS